jgi:hypothetical protein
MRIRQSIQWAYVESRLRASQDRDLFHTSRRRFLCLANYSCALLSCIHRNLNIVSQEICSLFGRIGVRYRGLDFVPVTRCYSMTPPIERPFLDSYNQSRISCIREMAANHPWATRVDLRVFLEGWDMGEKWASQKYNPEFCNSHMVASIRIEPYQDYTSEISS